MDLSSGFVTLKVFHQLAVRLLEAKVRRLDELRDGRENGVGSRSGIEMDLPAVPAVPATRTDFQWHQIVVSVEAIAIGTCLHLMAALPFQISEIVHLMSSPFDSSINQESPRPGESPVLHGNRSNVIDQFLPLVSGFTATNGQDERSGRSRWMSYVSLPSRKMGLICDFS
jgi:hypothetical protein